MEKDKRTIYSQNSNKSLMTIYYIWNHYNKYPQISVALPLKKPTKLTDEKKRSTSSDAFYLLLANEYLEQIIINIFI